MYRYLSPAELKALGYQRIPVLISDAIVFCLIFAGKGSIMEVDTLGGIWWRIKRHRSK